MESSICYNFVHRKFYHKVLDMEYLKNLEMSHIQGGGYWWRDSTGCWHYNPDDEEPDGDDVIGG